MWCHPQISSYGIDLVFIDTPVSLKQCFNHVDYLFNGKIHLKYGSATTPPIIPYYQKLQYQIFHIVMQKTPILEASGLLPFPEANFQNESLL